MPSLPLQDMIARAIETAREKLASEAPKEPEKVKNLLAYEKREHGHIPTPREEEEEEKEHEKQASAQLCSAEHVEKLASAVEYLAGHIGDIASPGPIAQALAKVAMKPGAGGGTAGGKSVPNPASSAGALQTTEAIGGAQKYTKNKAKGEQAEDEHSLPFGKARPHDGRTQLDNNMHSAPGNNSGAVPHTEYPHKGPMVAGPSGAHDRGKNGATEKAASGVDFVANKMAKHPRLVSGLVGGGAGAALGAAGGLAGSEHGHHLSGALKGGLAGGAMGALAGPYAMDAAGGHLAKNLAKTASPQEVARQHILSKLAGEDVMRAHIEGGGTSSPLAGKGQLKSMEAGQQSPVQGGGNAGGNESHGAGLVGSNKGAINYTKRDAKKLVVAPLKEVLDQPAFSEKHDNKLQENLRNTGKAGVKIAGVRAELQKIASAGCTCHSKGECQFCLMTSKLANMGGAVGTSPMSGAGESSDGCTCGSTGECRVCKLKAAMHAARGGQHGGEKNSNADCY